MLQSHKKHQWSRDGVEWTTPLFYFDDNDEDNDNGGSAVNWPKNTVTDDARRHLSIWGDDQDLLTQPTKNGGKKRGGGGPKKKSTAKEEPTEPGS
jgi:hypothetical protein